MPCCKAVRDNGRISLQDPAYARHMWETIGIQELFQDITVDGRHACGLNPNIRLYRQGQGVQCPKTDPVSGALRLSMVRIAA